MGNRTSFSYTPDESLENEATSYFLPPDNDSNMGGSIGSRNGSIVFPSTTQYSIEVSEFRHILTTFPALLVGQELEDTMLQDPQSRQRIQTMYQRDIEGQGRPCVPADTVSSSATTTAVSSSSSSSAPETQQQQKEQQRFRDRLHLLHPHHVVYIFTVTVKNAAAVSSSAPSSTTYTRTFTLRKTYRDFLSLHIALRKLYLHAIPALIHQPRWLTHHLYEPSCEERNYYGYYLRVYLLKLFELPRIHRCLIFREFFEYSSQSFNPLYGWKGKEGYLSLLSSAWYSRTIPCFPEQVDTVWYSLRHNYLMVYDSLGSTVPTDILYLDHNTRVYSGTVYPIQPCLPAFKINRYGRQRIRLGAPGHDPRSFTLQTNQGNFILHTRTLKDADDWILAIRERIQNSEMCQQNKPLASFTVPRRSNYARWMVDAQNTFAMMMQGLRAADKEIFITGWWVTPDLPLIRHHLVHYPHTSFTEWFRSHFTPSTAVTATKDDNGSSLPAPIVPNSGGSSTNGVDPVTTESVYGDRTAFVPSVPPSHSVESASSSFRPHRSHPSVDQALDDLAQPNLSADERETIQDIALKEILRERAEQGVQIYVLMYQEVSGTYALESRIQKRILKSLHPTNIHVQRHGSWFWSHHEKLIVIDRQVGYVGGLDLAWGRYDNASHILIDPDKKYFAGIDYYNADYADYVPPPVNEYASDRFDRSKLPRMPWHDIHCMVYGKVVDDLVYHYVQRWNFTRKSKGKESKLPILVPYSVRDREMVAGNADGKGNAVSSTSKTRDIGVQTVEDYTGILPTKGGTKGGERTKDGITFHTDPAWASQGYRKTRIADLMTMDDGYKNGQTKGETSQEREMNNPSSSSGNATSNPSSSRSPAIDNLKLPGFHFRRVPLSTTEWYCSSDWSQQWNRVNIQVLRSVGEWSAGCPTESSIYHGYIHAILNAQHSIYIENQYFLSSLGWNKEELLEFEVAAGLAATGRSRATEENAAPSSGSLTSSVVPASASSVSTPEETKEGIGKLQKPYLPESTLPSTVPPVDTSQPSTMDRYGYSSASRKTPRVPLKDKVTGLFPRTDKPAPGPSSSASVAKTDDETIASHRTGPSLGGSATAMLANELMQSRTLFPGTASATTDDTDYHYSRPFRSIVRKLVRRHRSEERVSTRNASLFTRPFRTSSDSTPYVTDPSTLNDDYQRYLWYLDHHQQGLVPKEFQQRTDTGESVATATGGSSLSQSFDRLRPALDRLRTKFPVPYPHLFGRHKPASTGTVATIGSPATVPSLSIEEQQRIAAVNRIRSQWLKHRDNNQSFVAAGTGMMSIDATNNTGIHVGRPIAPIPPSLLLSDEEKQWALTTPSATGIYGPPSTVLGEDESKTSSPTRGAREKWQAAVSAATVLGTDENIALESSGGGIMEWDPMKNSIAEALFVRLCTAIEKKQLFRTIVMLPLHPDGGPIKNSKSTKLIYFWELSTICRGGYSLLERLHRKYPTVDLNQYILFCALRNYNYLDNVPVTEQIYVHSKLMIVDDRVVIIGSANINDRSMYGDRDSEIALFISGGDKIDTRMGNQPWRASVFAHTLRRNLWEEHLGLDHTCRYSKALPRQSVVVKNREREVDYGTGSFSQTFGSTSRPPLWNFPFRIDNVHNPGCATRLRAPDTVHWRTAWEEFRKNPFRTDTLFTEENTDTADGDIRGSMPSNISNVSLMRTVQQRKHDILVAIAYMVYRNTHKHTPLPSSIEELTAVPPYRWCTVDALQDPCDTFFYNTVWLPIARQNTSIFDHVFPASMQNSIRTLQEWRERETLGPQDSALLENGIIGKLVLYPYEFLKDEDLSSRIVDKEHYLPRKVVQ